MSSRPPRFTGTLSRWDDARGFGFITPEGGGAPLFVHIRSFPGGTGRPALGQRLEFEVELAADGRKRARAVQYPAAASPVAQRARRVDAPARWTPARSLAIPAFGLLYAAAMWRGGLPPAVHALYLGASVLAFVLYAADKASAVRGGWRVSERTLLLLGLAGGWPGALLAQQWLRHKTTKASFVAAFWGSVLLNVAGFVAWRAGWLSPWLR